MQMSSVFTSVMLAPELHCTHLDEYNKRSSGPASQGALLKGSEAQHSLMHEHHGKPTHACSEREVIHAFISSSPRGNTANSLRDPG